MRNACIDGSVSAGILEDSIVYLLCIICVCEAKRIDKTPFKELTFLDCNKFIFKYDQKDGRSSIEQSLTRAETSSYEKHGEPGESASYKGFDGEDD